MSKEFQPRLELTMSHLNGENNRLGKRLFAIFGMGDAKVFVFPTPAEDETTSQFLAIFISGRMLIKIDKTNGGIRSEDVANFLFNRLDKKRRFWDKLLESPYGYYSNGDKTGDQLVLGEYVFANSNVESYREGSKPRSYGNCTLVKLPPMSNMGKNIIELNKRRAEKEMPLSTKR